MPEGPSILFLKNKLQRYKGKMVTEASGYGDLDKSGMTNIKLEDIDAYGKNLLFVFKDFFVGVHLGLFGSMLINKTKKVNASFALHFASAEINFYVAKAKRYEGKPADHFNFKTDILKPQFDPDFIINEMQSKHSDEMIGDVLMNQNIFAGVGNIIRIETLYHAKIHPESIVNAIPEKKLIFLLKTLNASALLFLMKLLKVLILHSTVIVVVRSPRIIDLSYKNFIHSMSLSISVVVLECMKWKNKIICMKKHCDSCYFYYSKKFR